MAARIGSRIREVLELLEKLGPSNIRPLQPLMVCDAPNTSKYCQRAVMLGLASRVRVGHGYVYTAIPGWRDRVGPESTDTPERKSVKNIGITDSAIRSRKRDPGNVWAGL